MEREIQMKEKDTKERDKLIKEIKEKETNLKEKDL